MSIQQGARGSRSHLRQTPAGLVLSHTDLGPEEVSLHGHQKCCRPVLRILAFTGQRIDLWCSGMTHETRSAHKVGFVREKGKAAPRDGQGAWKIGSSLSFTKGFFFWSFLLGKRVRSQGWSGLLTCLCRNIYTVLWKPPVYWPHGIFEASLGAMTYEAACPFAGCRALSALMM
jgi:hypothetical protein